MSRPLLADLIVLGMVCGAYLLYKSIKTIGEVPARVERRTRSLSRTEMLKTIEGLAYAALAIFFETLCLSKALFG